MYDFIKCGDCNECVEAVEESVSCKAAVPYYLLPCYVAVMTTSVVPLDGRMHFRNCFVQALLRLPSFANLLGLDLN